MNDNERLWSRLMQAARQDETPAPELTPGFAARVVAQAQARREATAQWSPAFVWRAVAVAAAITLVATTLQWRSWTGLVEAEVALMNTADVELESSEVL